MADETGSGTGIEQDRQRILEAQAKGTGATLAVYAKLSGPGWLQSAITLGGGSLAGSLYLGVLGGAALLWLQPIAMILGIIMLSAIAYVTLSTGERPFQAINRHVNPVLGWAWLIATMMANIVWAMPQFSLSTAAVQQNLLPDLPMSDITQKVIIAGTILGICSFIVWFYNSGSKGIRFVEIILKVMVGCIVLSFMGVVIKMTLTGSIQWREILSGFVPDLKLLVAPAATFEPFFEGATEEFRQYWSSLIVSQQRDVMITAAATAVGINMTFLLPYSMLRKGWGREFRGLAIFDLSTGLFVPFVVATSCVVIAAATQFHTQPGRGLLDEGGAPSATVQAKYDTIAKARATAIEGNTGEAIAIEDLSDADKRMAAMLIERDAFELAQSLSPLTGDAFANYVFGFGVLGMGISTIIILMLINGFVVCEMFNTPSSGLVHRLGSLIPAIGILGPFFWKRAAFWLAVPTSVFGMALLPIAYFTFYFLINQRSLLGDDRPRGAKGLAWNLAMLVAASLAAFGSVWSIWSKGSWWPKVGLPEWTGIGLLVAFLAVVLVVQVTRKRPV